MRILLAALMVYHGLAHSVGFAEAWQLVPQGPPYKTTILAGRLNLGDAGIRVTGILWLATGVAFLVAAIAAAVGLPWWDSFALVIAVVSLLLCAVELPEARLGLVINLAIVAMLVARAALD